MKQLLSIFGFIAIILGLVWVTSCSQNKEEEIKVITFNTTLGPIVIELFEEEAPVTAKNFLDYAENGFFNIVLFPDNISPGKILFPVDLAILLPLRVSILACIQIFAGLVLLKAMDCAISHS